MSLTCLRLLTAVSTDSDVLPIRPAERVYVPTGTSEYALLLTPGKGRGCNLNKFPNLRSFLEKEAKF
jgi:hypothetical protein